MSRYVGFTALMVWGEPLHYREDDPESMRQYLSYAREYLSRNWECWE